MSSLKLLGNFQKQAEKAGKKRKKPTAFEKIPERAGKTDKIFASGPKGRGFESRHFDTKTRDAPCGCPGFLLSGMMGKEPAAAAANEGSVSPVGCPAKPETPRVC